MESDPDPVQGSSATVPSWIVLIAGKSVILTKPPFPGAVGHPRIIISWSGWGGGGDFMVIRANSSWPGISFHFSRQDAVFIIFGDNYFTTSLKHNPG